MARATKNPTTAMPTEASISMYSIGSWRAASCAAWGAGLETGGKQLSDEIGAAQGVRHAEHTSEGGEQRQNHERIRHHRRRLVQVLLRVVVGAVLAVEGHEHLTEHIKGSQP